MSLTPLFGVRPKSAGNFPSGTKMLFQQSTAPVGWVKQTTHNDKALRVVSGSAGSGGATAFTTVFGAGKITGDTVLTIAQMPSHSHTILARTSVAGGGAVPAFNTTTDSQNVTTSSNGSGSAHNHSLSLDLQFVDLIIAMKS